ncbi:related to Pre-mRNA-splicing factor BUD31 [Saccharomycodes ludwigii]|uniref:Related to Pre-mRNA-splicing factor BUD31 n=1 Tax=Saccharomycodes ludwigii TaxID=36035 RepID=A0A376B5S8_9ASCO|nr:related to Pre-mRNA-splicing factor BUD31 [Saccharomycodes ludwigii]
MSYKSNNKKKLKNVPDGYDKIKQVLDDYDHQLRLITINNKKDTGTNNSNLMSNDEDLWEIYKINHLKSKYIYDLYYKRKIINAKLYHWLLNNNIVDRHLIAKWKKRGYEKLCCIRCIEQSNGSSVTSKDGIKGKVCICRVPKSVLLSKEKERQKNNNEEEGKNTPDDDDLFKVVIKPCGRCGCNGCASTD